MVPYHLSFPVLLDIDNRSRKVLVTEILLGWQGEIRGDVACVATRKDFLGAVGKYRDRDWIRKARVGTLRCVALLTTCLVE